MIRFIRNFAFLNFERGTQMKKAINQSTLSLVLNGISIIALVIMAVSLVSYNDANKQLRKAYEDRFNLTYNANRFMNGSAYLTNEVRAFAATGNETHYNNYMNEVNNLKNRDKGVSVMQEIGITDDEQAMINEMSSISNELVPLEETAMRQTKGGQNEIAINYVYGEDYETAITKINALKEEFLQKLNDRTAQTVGNLVNKVDFIKKEMQVWLAIVAILQLFSMIIIRHRILRPVTIIRDQMIEISKGNLSSDFSLEPDTSEIGMLVDSIYTTKHDLKKYINDIDIKLASMANGNMDLEIEDNYQGEFLPIQDAMHKILDSLNNILSKINFTAEKVLSESKRMASGAQTLSTGAERQASAVHKLSSNIQEISRNIDHTSNDANNAKKYSSDGSKQLELCNSKMAELSAAMQEISGSSQQIGGIIKTIEDISYQTNILALNASVEAARAGTAGKGFAVVAGEVQSLANKSAEAAKNISGLISESISLIEQGASLTNSTKLILADVVNNAQQSTNLIGNIAASATQQSQSLRLATQEMEQISEIVQTTAATAEESSMSAQQLYNHSDELKNAIHSFQLRNNYNNIQVL